MSRPRFSEDGSYECGDFRPDGSWNPDADRPEDRNPIRHLYWFVDMMVTKRRRSPEVYPARFAERIMESRFKAAFPNAAAGLWHQRNGANVNWLDAACLTSAEQAVLRAGRGFTDSGSPAVPCYFPPDEVAVHYPEVVNRLVSTIIKGMS